MSREAADVAVSSKDEMVDMPAEKIPATISEEMSVMRTTLAPSMLETLVRNLRRGNAGARLYELANVYLAKELPLRELPEERAVLCVGLCGAGEG